MMSEPNSDDNWGPLSALPGNPLMWILILGELIVFAAFFVFYGAARAQEPELFAQSQQSLNAFVGGLNTMILLTSGLFVALAVEKTARAQLGRARQWLLGAMVLGVVFCVVKVVEYQGKVQAGFMPETNTFFTFYYLLTGFHFAHVLFGLILLGIALRQTDLPTMETVGAFWHMVDLIWVLLYPLLYLLR